MSGRSVCRTGKQAYRDEEVAIAALRHVRAKYNESKSDPRGPLHPYLCTCGQWHLGHSYDGYAKWKRRIAHERRVARTRTRKARLAMRHARPVWFLDVDGTIAPTGSGITTEDVASGDWALLYPGMVGDVSAPYRPTVVRRIQALQRRALVEMRWLTAWEPQTLGAWTEAGLGPFRPARRIQTGRRRSWKSNTVENWMRANPHRRAIWTDDDLTPSRLRGFDRDRLLAVSPDPTTGLTGEHLDHIERWLSL